METGPHDYSRSTIRLDASQCYVLHEANTNGSSMMCSAGIRIARLGETIPYTRHTIHHGLDKISAFHFWHLDYAPMLHSCTVPRGVACKNAAWLVLTVLPPTSSSAWLTAWPFYEARTKQCERIYKCTPHYFYPIPLSDQDHHSLHSSTVFAYLHKSLVESFGR